MGNLVHLHGDAHEQTLKLLPWYLNGTLDDGEAAMVEAHLVECEACSREAESERGLRDGVTSLGVDPDRGWATMRERIEGAEAAAPTPTPLLRRRIGIGWAAGGALAASLVAIALTALQPTPTNNIYHALGAATDATRPVANAIILFAPDTSAQAMHDTLSSAGARITDGPLASGGFMLRLDPQRRSQQLAQLRGRRGVVMAEPIDTPARQ